MSKLGLPLSRLSPNGFWLWQYTGDPSVRFIVLYGGSSSGKSFSVAQMLINRACQEKSNTLVMRKVGASIEKTIYSDFRAAAKTLDVTGLRFKQNSILKQSISRHELFQD